MAIKSPLASMFCEALDVLEMHIYHLHSVGDERMQNEPSL